MTFATDAVDAAMTKAVALRGEQFRYGTHYLDQPAKYDSESGGCQYVAGVTDEDEILPACIIGWVFVILGLPTPTINTSCDVNTVHEGLFTPKAVAFMRAAQLVQDYNGTWGQSLSSARLTVQGYDEDGRSTKLLDAAALHIGDDSALANGGAEAALF